MRRPMHASSGRKMGRAFRLGGFGWGGHGVGQGDKKAQGLPFGRTAIIASASEGSQRRGFGLGLDLLGSFIRSGKRARESEEAGEVGQREAL